MTKTFGRILLASSSVIITLGVVTGILLFWRSRKPPSDFLVEEADYYIADALAGHLHKPNAKREYAWNEHPKGRIIVRTNNLGFREDSDTDIKKTDNVVRILVTGDSHTDGVVTNAETFPNLLEEKLNARSPVPKFEVINGGVGYYTFQNYAGFLRRHIDLRPDYFIVTVYLGNDFMEAIQFAVKRGELPPQSRSLSYHQRLSQASGPAVSQGGNQLVYFDSYPEMKAKALEIAQQQIKEINDICLQNKIQLLFVLLPTKLDLEENARRQAASNLQLTEAQMDLNQALKRSLIDLLARERVGCLDLTDYLKKEHEPLFWEQDYHLNDKGHRLVAELLFDRLASVLLSRSTVTNRPASRMTLESSPPKTVIWFGPKLPGLSSLALGSTLVKNLP